MLAAKWIMLKKDMKLGETGNEKETTPGRKSKTARTWSGTCVNIVRYMCCRTRLGKWTLDSRFETSTKGMTMEILNIMRKRRLDSDYVSQSMMQ